MEPERPSAGRKVFSAQIPSRESSEKSLEIAKSGAVTPLLPGYEGAQFPTGFGHGGHFVANSMVQGWLIEQRSSALSLEMRSFFEARNETRTRDPFLTMEVLYQLSYPGAAALLSQIL
jgi:hypothetical protein